MDNKISLYRGLPGNREFSGIQGLPYFVFNPLRNLLLTKEDIDHSSPAKDMMTESGLGMANPTTSSSTSGGTGYSSRTMNDKLKDDGQGRAHDPMPGPYLTNSGDATNSGPAPVTFERDRITEGGGDTAYNNTFNGNYDPIVVCSDGGTAKDGVCPPGQYNIAG